MPKKEASKQRWTIIQPSKEAMREADEIGRKAWKETEKLTEAFEKSIDTRSLQIDKGKTINLWEVYTFATIMAFGAGYLFWSLFWSIGQFLFMFHWC